MTVAKANHLTARRLLLEHLDRHPGRTVHDDLDPLEAGIVGDATHAGGGDSYHLGRDDLRAGRDRYSVDESRRDRDGLDEHASALDIGYFKVRTPRGAFDLYDFNAWLVPLCRADDPDTRDLREVIYSPDGETVRRWDRLGRRTTGDDSHRTHTHLSEHRDADGHRMVRLVTRWLTHIGLIPEEGTMTKTEFLTMLKDKDVRAALAGAMLQTDGLIPAPPGNRSRDGSVNTHWSLASYAQWTYRHLLDARAAIVTLATRDGVDEVALARALAPMLVAALPDDRDDLTPAELQQAIVGALRELAA
ncbi:hypothetical protein Aph02nite_25440 [Actinoplanes philippinensis]|uniref:Uncharacterized protein n=1 Tax=Actinoplanes philippinensis TaxID=35752 RepID=A0A1I2G513_9ACTN|nr:hypothetical protein [Actinoplanes philippinensis]GIE76594.1 hypothetical protein Aph02nite_25440 [Actinoplanes philippinensis]SFF12268.1 hypothetical protein SAMN05421541_106201 [Actinoplanes philippinensis]